MTAKKTHRRSLIGATASAALCLCLAPADSGASSHREAPLIAEDPAADGTDLYAFRSPASDANAVANSVTIVANYWPLEEPGGGPNFPRFSDQVLYEIHIDNTGDAKADITYQFRFKTEYKNPLSFLLNGGPVTSPTDANLRVVQRYSVTRVDAKGSTVLLKDKETPPAYVGNFSMANYAAIANAAIYPLNNDRATNGVVFAGQRDDPFFVDLGAVFDLVRIRCSATPNDATGCGGNANAKKGVDFVGGYNVHALALQVPITQLTADGTAPAASSKGSVLGIWTTASRPRVVIRRAPSLASAGKVPVQEAAGPWVQVSRLGIPLINEVIVPLGFKDYYNSTQPTNDAALFTSAVGMPLLTNPELAQALKALYGIPVPDAGRTDILELVQFGVRASAAGAFVGPFKGIEYGLAPADILRVDVALAAPTNLTVNPLGVAGVAFAGVVDPNIGFPNGRRLQDDIVDIEEKVVGGALRGTAAAAGLSDAVNGNDLPFLAAFPYVPHPWSGSTVNVTGSTKQLHTPQ